jgi:hypothetical protein
VDTGDGEGILDSRDWVACVECAEPVSLSLTLSVSLSLCICMCL